MNMPHRNDVLTYEFCWSEYVVKRKSIGRICKEFKLNKECVTRRLRRHGIPRRHGRDAIGIYSLVGNTFNRLRVDKEVFRGGRSHIEYQCTCACGKVVPFVARAHLISGHTQSCGCLWKEQIRRIRRGYREIPAKVWSRIIKRAEMRNLPFEISIEYAWSIYEKQNRLCALSGRPIDWKSTTDRPSLDRIDNNKGYLIGNVQWTTKDVNLAKRMLSQAKFIEMCRDVVRVNSL